MSPLRPRNRRRPGPAARLALALGIAIAATLAARPVRADAVVEVTLRDPAGHPADGTVTLSGGGGGSTYSCTAQGGSCRITGVAGGRYTGTVAAPGADAPRPRTVMIPP